MTRSAAQIVGEKAGASAVSGTEDTPADAPITRRRRIIGNEVGVAAAIAILLLVTGLTHPNFVTVRSLSSIGQAAAFFALMSLGMVFLLAMREIDLSVGSMYGLTIVIAALMIQHGWNPWLAAATGIVSGAVLGAVNGIVASLFRVPVLIVTLGSLTAYSGISNALTKSQTISLPATGAFFDKVGGSYFQVPFMVYAAVVFAIVLSVVFNRTRFGFAVKSIGANPRAAELSGYRITRMRIAVTTLSGALCGVAGMLTLAYFGAADPSQGNGYEIQVIAAAIIGGTSLLGGSGTVLGALLGAVLISLIQAALIQFGVSANLGYIVTGVVIVAAVGLDSTIRRLRTARMNRV